jgi:anti-sigma regulatory factor (Ser/Thr protein kinase)
LRELALHLLDIAHNSVSAQAKNITITVIEDIRADLLAITVEDDGRGMDTHTVQKVVDPFVTSRVTRNVGLGIPLLKAGAEACNGDLTIHSTLGVGTRLKVTFQRSHIDRIPLGDLAETFFSLVVGCPEVHWRFTYQVDQEAFEFDDAPIKAELEGISLTEPSILAYLRELIQQGIDQVQKSAQVI